MKVVKCDIILISINMFAFIYVCAKSCIISCMYMYVYIKLRLSILCNLNIMFRLN